MQLVPPVPAGVLPVEQHVQRAPDGGGHPRPVPVEPAQLRGHRSQFRVGISFPVVRIAGIRGERIQAGQRELASRAPIGPGRRRHAGQRELAGDGLEVTGTLEAARPGGRLAAAGPGSRWRL